jgi:hypothetical protein
MITKIRYADIDFQKYDDCLKTSVQKNFYANKYVLDHLCEQWELLIYGDYEFVMPVPLKRKFGFKIVLSPLFCQQLGVFGPVENKIIENDFYHFLLENYKIRYYPFNFQNRVNAITKKKKNYFVSRTDYKILRKYYFKGRKSTVKTAQYLTFKELKLESSVTFCRQNFKGLDKKKDLDKFFNYLIFLEKQKILRVFGAFKESELASVALITDFDEKLSLLGLINDEELKADNGASFLIDYLLKENIQQKSFDFMGGSIRGIEVFFKSFGSELQEYAIIENSKKDLIKRLFGNR